MESQYIYWIVALAILAIVALAVIIRYRKAKVSIRAPGVGLDAEGETGPEQPPQPAPQAKAPLATTTIGGSVRDSTVMTDAGGGGQAATDVKGDVEESDILTEA
jgi:hypothetical protein